MPQLLLEHRERDEFVREQSRRALPFSYYGGIFLPIDNPREIS
jgi:hypothetical protein